MFYYEAYQAQADALAPIRWMARTAERFLNQQPFPPLAHHPMVRSAAAACEMVARAGMWHERPDFRIGTAEVAGERVPVTERIVARHPFCNLLHFEKERGAAGPRVLLVAPLSGH